MKRGDRKGVTAFGTPYYDLETPDPSGLPNPNRNFLQTLTAAPVGRKYAANNVDRDYTRMVLLPYQRQAFIRRPIDSPNRIHTQRDYKALRSIGEYAVTSDPNPGRYQL